MQNSDFLELLNIIAVLDIHYCEVIMGVMASQITSIMIVYSTIHLSADQRKHQTSASLAFERGIHWWPVNSPHKWPVTRKMFRFDDVIMGNCGTPPVRGTGLGVCVFLLLNITSHNWLRNKYLGNLMFIYLCVCIYKLSGDVSILGPFLRILDWTCLLPRRAEVCFINKDILQRCFLPCDWVSLQGLTSWMNCIFGPSFGKSIFTELVWKFDMVENNVSLFIFTYR